MRLSLVKLLPVLRASAEGHTAGQYISLRTLQKETAAVEEWRIVGIWFGRMANRNSQIATILAGVLHFGFYGREREGNQKAENRELRAYANCG